jgi:hypothetical protein
MSDSLKQCQKHFGIKNFSVMLFDVLLLKHEYIDRNQIVMRLFKRILIKKKFNTSDF